MRARRRTVGVIGGLVALLVVGLAGGWALREMSTPAPDVLATTGYTLTEAQPGTVGQSLQLNTSGQWRPHTTVASQATGIITTVELAASEEVQPGEVLFTVNLRPVVVGTGQVPAFRDLTSGTSGEDVAQLQQLLAWLGYYHGSADGVFSTEVRQAVRAWQQDLGSTVDGVVRRGDVMFFPELPTRLALTDEVAVGAQLAGGEPLVQVLPPAPEFSIDLPEDQAQLVGAGMPVEILADDTEPWLAKITDVRSAPEAGGLVAVLGSLDDDEPICGEQCAQIPLGEPTLLPSVIHVMPEVAGVTVPAAALVSNAGGEVGVVLANGEFQPVDVVASVTGTALVYGVEVGEQVRLPGTLPATDQPDDQ